MPPEENEGRELVRSKEKRYKWPKRTVILSIFSGPMVAAEMAYVWSRPLFITQELRMKENYGMFLSHFPEAIKLVSGIIAGIVADSYLGKFLVIASSYILMNLLYWPLLVFSSFPSFNILTRTIIFITGLFVGSIVAYGYPLHLTFISEQFRLPNEEQALETYYVYDYAYINLSVVIFANIILELSGYYSCLGITTCYPIIFCAGNLLCILFVVIFISMKKSYVIRLPKSSIIKEAISCICYAIKRKRKLYATRAPIVKKDLLDYANDKFDQQLIHDLKRLKSILLVIIINMFYSLLYQQITSKWIYQADMLDGNFGNKWTMKPAQVNMINPIIVVLLVPFIQHVIYPTLRTYEVNFTSLRKIGCGYILACLTFILAGIIQYQIDANIAEKTNPDKGQLLIFNFYHGPVSVSTSWFDTEIIPKFSKILFNNLDVIGKEKNTMVIKNGTDFFWTGTVEAVRGSSVTYIITEYAATRINGTMKIKENELEMPTVFLYCCDHCNGTFQFILSNNESIRSKLVNIPDSNNSVRIELPMPGVYKTNINGKILTHLTSFKRKSLYATVILDKEGKTTEQTFLIYDPYGIHILTIFPQFIILSMSEVLQYSGMSMFIFTQAPPTMRSFVRALFNGTISIAQFFLALLSLIDVSATTWFFSFALIQIVGICLHVMVAKRFVYQTSQD